MGIYDRIKELARKNGITITEIEEDLGFGRGALSKIDRNEPSLSKMRKIADYFNVTIDFLETGDEREIRHIPDDIIECAKKLIEMDLDPQKLREWLDFINKVQKK